MKRKILSLFIIVLTFLSFVPYVKATCPTYLHTAGNNCCWPWCNPDCCPHHYYDGECCHYWFAGSCYCGLFADDCDYLTSDPEPPCNNYCSGNIWYHNANPACTDYGWDCSYETTTCSPSGCCDATCSASSGCGLSPNSANCPSDGWYDSKCDGTGDYGWSCIAEYENYLCQRVKAQYYRDYSCNSACNCVCSDTNTRDYYDNCPENYYCTGAAGSAVCVPGRCKTKGSYCYDYCGGKKLFEYDNDCVKDWTSVSCNRYCDGSGICQDCTPTCPGTTAHCCKGVCGAECDSDDDCPGGYKCDLATCTCYWYACVTNSDCPSGQCCDIDPSGPGGTGVCVGKGYISGAYLCDPPEWGATEVGETKSQNIFELILNFFSQFFFQR